MSAYVMSPYECTRVTTVLVCHSLVVMACFRQLDWLQLQLLAVCSLQLVAVQHVCRARDPEFTASSVFFKEDGPCFAPVRLAYLVASMACSQDRIFSRDSDKSWTLFSNMKIAYGRCHNLGVPLFFICFLRSPGLESTKGLCS